MNTPLDKLFGGFFGKPDHPYSMLPVWTEENDEYFAPAGARRNESKEPGENSRIFSPLALNKKIPLKKVCQYKTGPMGDDDRPSIAIKMQSLICQLLGVYYTFDISSAELTDFEFSNSAYKIKQFNELCMRRERYLDLPLLNLMNPVVVKGQKNLRIILRTSGMYDIATCEIYVTADFELELGEGADPQLAAALNAGFSVVGFEIDVVGKVAEK